MRTAARTGVKEFLIVIQIQLNKQNPLRGKNVLNILELWTERIHFCDQHQSASGTKEVQQTGDSGVSQTGEQVPLLEGPGPSAAPQRQELSSKHLPCSSVDHTLHYPEGSPKTQGADVDRIKE